MARKVFFETTQKDKKTKEKKYAVVG